MKRFALTSILCASLMGGAYAQTVTVDASNGSPDNVTTFSSLQLAIKSFQASGGTAASTDGSGVGVNHGNVAADVINIATTAVVDESVTADAEAAGADQTVLDEALTIQGDGGQATVALKQDGTASPFNDCGLGWRQSVDITINDVVFIPSLADTPADDGLYFRQPGAAVDVVVNLNNVVVTSNDGSNGPVTLDGSGSPDLTAATQFGDDGMYVVSNTAGGSITLNATDMVISTIPGDALLVFMTGATNDIINAIANIGEGCVFSNAGRFGIQNPYGGHVNIAGSASKPVIFNNLDGDGIWAFSDGAGQATVTTVDHAIFNNIGATALKEQETAGRGFIASVTNTRIANCGAAGIELYSSGTLDPASLATSTVTVSNVTIHNCGGGVLDPGTDYDFRAGQLVAPQYQTTNKSNRNVDIDECIFSGSVNLTGLYNSADGSFTADYCGIVTSGNGALGLATDGSGSITTNNVINDEVIYVNENDPFAPNFLAVRSLTNNPSPYETAGPGGTALTGGGVLVQVNITNSTNAWQMYQ